MYNLSILCAVSFLHSVKLILCSLICIIGLLSGVLDSGTSSPARMPWGGCVSGFVGILKLKNIT
jgi:hypothetical protein